MHSRNFPLSHLNPGTIAIRQIHLLTVVIFCTVIISKKRQHVNMLPKIYMFFFRSGSSVSDASAAACRLFSSEILIYVE